MDILDIFSQKWEQLFLIFSDKQINLQWQWIIIYGKTLLPLWTHKDINPRQIWNFWKFVFNIFQIRSFTESSFNVGIFIFGWASRHTTLESGLTIKRGWVEQRIPSGFEEKKFHVLLEFGNLCAKNSPHSVFFNSFSFSSQLSFTCSTLSTFFTSSTCSNNSTCSTCKYIYFNLLLRDK